MLVVEMYGCFWVRDGWVDECAGCCGGGEGGGGAIGWDGVLVWRLDIEVGVQRSLGILLRFVYRSSDLGVVI